MTIGRGESWGRDVPPAPDAIEATSDTQVAQLLVAGESRQILLRSGDLFRTLGGTRADRAVRTEFPIDLVHAELDSGIGVDAVAHITASARWWRGSWMRGQLLLLMNAEFLGPYDVAPRGHPNDGAVEAFSCDSDLSVRQRRLARRRARAAAHLPHPAIRVRRVRSEVWEFDEPLVIRVDGRGVGTSRSLRVEVRPDAGVVAL